MESCQLESGSDAQLRLVEQWLNTEVLPNELGSDDRVGVKRAVEQFVVTNDKLCKYICSIVDSHTRYEEMVPTRPHDVTFAIQAMKTGWIQRWGAPQILMADAAQVFNRQRRLDFCRSKVVHPIQVPPFLQRANGLNEGLTQTMLNLLRRFILSRGGGEWVDGISRVLSIYRNITHSTMQMSPNSTLFGFDLRLFVTLPLVPPPNLFA